MEPVIQVSMQPPKSMDKSFRDARNNCILFDVYILYNIFNIDLTYETATQSKMLGKAHICFSFSCYMYTWYICGFLRKVFLNIYFIIINVYKCMCIKILVNCVRLVFELMSTL